MVLFDMKQRQPDTTDAAALAPSTAATAPMSSRNREPTNARASGVNPSHARGSTAAEEGEEESETDDDMDVEPPAEGGTADQLRNLLENIRLQQNYCLANERFEEAPELQVSQMSILECRAL